MVSDMLAAASAAGDRDLVAQARQLRAAALLELGDPEGRAELLAYVGLAEGLGHARGRWGALTRRATYAQLAGQVDDAVRLGEEALTLGLAIQEPDAMGCFSTHRWSLGVFGVPEPELPIDGADPMWPTVPADPRLVPRRARRRGRTRDGCSATSACSTSVSPTT